jgi:hypothetical protein
MLRRVILAVLVALAATASAQERVGGLDKEHITSVLATVHANPEAHVRGSERTSKGEHCLREFTRDIQPVCASNGKRYINLSIFAYEQCLLRAQEDTVLRIVDMELCKEAQLEDLGQL